MAQKRPRVPLLVRFRGLLLVAAIAGALLLVALYLFGRSGLPPQAVPADPERERRSSGPEGDTTLRSEGFDYTHFEEGSPLFRVQGETQRVDRQKKNHLEGVSIDLYQEEGDPFQVVSRRAIYDQPSTSAELEGAVHVVGPEGLELWTEKLRVVQRGKRIVSPVPVRFLYSRTIEGRSNRMRVEVPARLFLLQGRVRLRSTGESGVEASLASERGFFEQDRRLMRAEGGVRLTYGQDVLECQRLSAYLVEDRDAIRFVRAQWKVKGRLTVPASGVGGSAAEALPMDVAAEAISLLMNVEGTRPTKVEMEGSERQSAELETVDPATRIVRLMTSNYMVGDFGERALEQVQAFGQVRIAEFAPGKGRNDGPPLRIARGERADGSFDDAGSLEVLTLIGAVDYREGTLQVTSERARLNPSQGRAAFTGSPARMETEEGDVLAPSLAYARDQEILEAKGGVKTALQLQGREAVPGPVLSSGSGPVWVESEEALWRRGTDTAVFQGGVKAWRGKDLLLAETLEVDRRQDRLEAEGKVKTIWHPERKGSEEAEQGPLEVTADKFLYEGAEDRIHYAGNVDILDGARRMKCGETDALLAEDNSLTRLECRGGAVLRESRQGRVAEGQRAVYDPQAGSVEIWGDPVTLKDRRGTQLQGRHLIYRIADGSVEFLRAEKPAAKEDETQGSASAEPEPAEQEPAEQGPEEQETAAETTP